jgi:hypothetical protein
VAGKSPESDRPWSPSRSQLVLLIAGLIAWAIATALAAAETSVPVATTFAGAGLALIGAAAFYGRLRKLGPSGVEVDPAEVVREFGERAPPPPEGASASGERENVLEALQSVFVEVPSEYPQEPPIYTVNYDAALERSITAYNRSIRLEVAARDWLMKEGFELLDGGGQTGVDYLGQRDGEIWVVEAKTARSAVGHPTPEQLRDAFLRARLWVDQHVGDGGGFYRVLVVDAIPPEPLRERFVDQGIGIAYVDPEGESGETSVTMIVPPRNSRD